MGQAGAGEQEEEVAETVFDWLENTHTLNSIAVSRRGTWGKWSLNAQLTLLIISPS